MSMIQLPPPLWIELSSPVQSDLESRGFDEMWFNTIEAGADEEVRLTVLNIYAKLRSMMIAGVPGWSFVGKKLWAGKGSFIFSTDERKLIRCLYHDDNFANPDVPEDPRPPVRFDAPNEWDSRELCAWGSLHFRGKLTQEVAVHIDPAGLASRPGVLGKLDPRAWRAHWDTWKYDRWAQVDYIRSILLKQGYAKDVLVKP